MLYHENGDSIIIDPGCYEKYEEEELAGFIESNGLKVRQLINTHCHIDHVLGNAFVKNRYGVKLYIHPIDEATLRAVKTYAPLYGFHRFQESEPDAFLNEGDQITLGDSVFDIVFVPGHCPGHIALINHQQHFVIGGDVLFDGSVGRTDLPGGDMDTLIESIHSKLFTLPDNYIVHCGHGPSTTIGKEKKTNPFCGLGG